MEVKPPIERVLIATAQIDEATDEDVYQFLTHFADHDYKVNVAVEVEETPRVPATLETPAYGGWEPTGMYLILHKGSLREKWIPMSDMVFDAVYPTIAGKILHHLETGVAG